MPRFLLCLVLLAVPLCAQEFQMRCYVMAILEKGPKWTKESTPEVKELLKGHMANIGRLAKEKKLILAGPLAGAGDAAGRFQVKLWKWYSAKGIGILPDSK